MAFRSPCLHSAILRSILPDSSQRDLLKHRTDGFIFSLKTLQWPPVALRLKSKLLTRPTRPSASGLIFTPLLSPCSLRWNHPGLGYFFLMCHFILTLGPLHLLFLLSGTPHIHPLLFVWLALSHPIVLILKVTSAERPWLISPTKHSPTHTTIVSFNPFSS